MLRWLIRLVRRWFRHRHTAEVPIGAQVRVEPD